jgi:diguanylate cyclase (GGDEF)-like protein
METYIIPVVSLFVGFFLGYAASFRKFTNERKKAGEDYLTKVFNYREFDKKMDEIIHFRTGYNAASLFDLDHFKKINETYDYEAGDQVLTQFVEVISSHIRSSDMLFRFKNGDEFVVLFRNLPEDQLKAINDRLRNSIENSSFVCKNQTVHLTVSAGTTLIKENETKDTLIKRLEKSLKVAKEEGNKVFAL